MKILYLDQNAWIALAQGAWDKAKFPQEHAALTIVIKALNAHGWIVPLSFSNIYETYKINDPERRRHLARVQVTISKGKVLRGRRSLISETLKTYIASQFSIAHAPLESLWFLSDLWFESVTNDSRDIFGYEIPESYIKFCQKNSSRVLYDFLVNSNDDVRREAIRRYSDGSDKLITRLESNRELVSGEPFALRRKIYGARLLMEELEFVFQIANQLGLDWKNVDDMGGSLCRNLLIDIPAFNVERELAIRLNDQPRKIEPNDLRDMFAFMSALPHADVLIAEKQFVNLARQAKLDVSCKTLLLTSVHDFDSNMLLAKW
jgi:hypothetical protein